MQCPFLKPHQCVNCESGRFRCDAHAPLIQVIEEDLQDCFLDSHTECDFYTVGMNYLDAEAQRRIKNKKKNTIIDRAMEEVEVVLNKKTGIYGMPERLNVEETLQWQLEKLKELYRARLSDRYEYRESLRRCKGELNGAK